MIARWLGLLVVAGVVLSADPAAAAVRYDPKTMTGLVGGDDLREAFGWSRATLTAKAGGVVFDHDFWTVDNYEVTCGKRRFRVAHHHDFGRFELTDTLARDGYGGVIFRLTGAHAGISGTSVPPEPGQPCPGDQKPEDPKTEIDRVRLVSTAKGWSLSATSGDRRVVLLGKGPTAARS